LAQLLALCAKTDARILGEIGRHIDGTGIDAIHARLADAISRRTLQRRLAQFENLYEGNAIRFGIRPLEFAAWRDKTTQ